MDQEIIEIKEDNTLPVNKFNIDKTKEQLGVFILNQAVRELQRVVKLTDTLDMLQDKYVEKITEYINDNDDETAVTYIPEMIENIALYLSRANDTISRVLNDKDIMNMMIINTDNRSINISNMEDSKSAIEDPVSRARVRDAVAKIINMIEN